MKSNPYVIASDRIGGQFDEADALALSLGFEEDSPPRIAAALIFEMVHNLNNGHSFLPREKLVAATAQLIGVEAEAAEECLDVLADEGEERDECGGHALAVAATLRAGVVVGPTHGALHA